MKWLALLLGAMVLMSGLQWSIQLPLPGAGKPGIMLSPADLLLGVAALATIYLAVKGKLKWSRLIPSWRTPALVGVMAASWIVTGPGTAGLKEILQITGILVIGTVLFRQAVQEGYERYLSPALVAAVLVTAGVGLFQRFAHTGTPFLWRGLLENRNYLGGFIAFALPFMAGEYILPASEKALPLRIAAAAAFAGCLLLIPNLIVAAALVAGTALALDAGEKRGLISPLVRIPVLLVIVGTICLSVLQEDMHGGFALYRKDLGKYRPSARAGRWQAVLLSAEENPLLGLGPGRFQDRIGGYYYHGISKPEGFTDDIEGYDIRADEPGTQSHWEVVLAETGILGTAAWIIILMGGMVTALRHGRPAVAGALLAAALAGLSVAVWARSIGVLWAYMLALAECSRTPLQTTDTS